MVAGSGGALLLLADDIHGLDDELRAAEVETGEIEHALSMRPGKSRVVDPDGFVLLVGQLDEPRVIEPRAGRRLSPHLTMGRLEASS